MPWLGSVGILQAAVLELLEQEGHALEAVAAVAVAGVGQEADQRLVELHALRASRGPSAETAPLAPCAEIAPGPLESSRPTSDLERRTGLLGVGFWPSHRQEAQVGHRALAEQLGVRRCRRSGPLVRARRRSTDAPTITPNSRRYQGSALGRQPEMRLRISGPQAIVVAIAARTASRDSRPSRLSQVAAGTPTCAPRASSAASIASGRGVGARPAPGTARASPRRRRSRRRRSPRRARSCSPSAANRSISARVQAQRALDALRADDRRRRGQHRVRRVAGLARRLRRRPGSGRRCRLTSAPTATSSSARSFSPPGSCTSGRRSWPRSGYSARSSIETPCRLRDLGLRVHLRRARAVLHRLPREHGADLRVQRGDLLRRRARARVTTGRSSSAGSSRPWSLSRTRASAPGCPRGAKSGCAPFARHHRGQRRRDVGDVGDHRALAPRRPGCSGVKMRVDAERLHEPAFLARGIVAAAGHRAGMADRARQLALPAPDDAGDDRLGELDVELVVAARLGSRAPPPCCARRCRKREARTRARRSGCRRPCRSRSASSCPSRPCAGTARSSW